MRGRNSSKFTVATGEAADSTRGSALSALNTFSLLQGLVYMLATSWHAMEDDKEEREEGEEGRGGEGREGGGGGAGGRRRGGGGEIARAGEGWSLARVHDACDDVASTTH